MFLRRQFHTAVGIDHVGIGHKVATHTKLHDKGVGCGAADGATNRGDDVLHAVGARSTGASSRLMAIRDHAQSTLVSAAPMAQSAQAMQLDTVLGRRSPKTIVEKMKKLRIGTKKARSAAKKVRSTERKMRSGEKKVRNAGKKMRNAAEKMRPFVYVIVVGLG